MQIHYENKIDVTERLKIILQTAINPFHLLVTFDNGLSASIIRHPGSYGYKDDLFEMAVWEDNEMIGEDPYGWLDSLSVLLGPGSAG